MTTPAEDRLQARIEELEARLDSKLRSSDRWEEWYEQEHAARVRAERERQEAVDARDSYVRLTAEHRLAHDKLVGERDAANERESLTNETNWKLIAHIGTLQRALNLIADMSGSTATNGDRALIAARALDAVAKDA
jgi:hypothetical protein